MIGRGALARFSREALRALVRAGRAKPMGESRARLVSVAFSIREAAKVPMRKELRAKAALATPVARKALDSRRAVGRFRLRLRSAHVPQAARCFANCARRCRRTARFPVMPKDWRLRRVRFSLFRSALGDRLLRLRLGLGLRPGLSLRLRLGLCLRLDLRLRLDLNLFSRLWTHMGLRLRVRLSFRIHFRHLPMLRQSPPL